ncbi:MAG: sulfotransferase family protein [Hellea sp.]|nr:sulfotransferase family protein [Hellea sp.]
MKDLSISGGLAALSKGHYKPVHERCIAAIQTDHLNPVPFFLLGVIALDHKNFLKALELFEKAEMMDPKQVYNPAYAAKTLSLLRRPGAAKICADRAAKLTIKDGYIADQIGVVYSRTGFHELAIKLFLQAVSHKNPHANSFYNLGASELFLGHFENAKQAYSNALKRDENHYGALASMIALEKQTEDNHRLDQLKDLYDRLADNEDAAHQLGHTIAKTLEDLGHYDESLGWLQKAKSVKREKFAYDRNLGKKMFEAAKTTIGATSITPNSETTPLFVVGMPRTGTTLVDRILSSHSKVVSAGELNFFAEIIKSETGTSSNMVMDGETFDAARNLDLVNAAYTYLDRVEARLGTCAYFVDKMPLNFFYAGLIHKAFPNARIVALRRGAMDSCLSNYRQLLSVQESFYNYTFDLEDTAFFYRQFDDLMRHWREHLPAGRFMEIHYEDIVFDQENQTRKLLKFCGLEFEEACLRFHENAAPVSTASSVQVRQPLYSGSIGRWKKYGDKLNGLRTALGDLAG